jgi:hypothetical protein
MQDADASYPLLRVRAGQVTPPTDKPLHTSQRDSAGRQRILSDSIQGVYAFDTRNTPFRNHEITYFGYGADGFFYSQGAPNPAYTPFEATWASEAPGLHRGSATAFPERLLVVVTAVEVALLDLDTLDLWMRFILVGPASLSMDQIFWLRGSALGGAYGYHVYDVTFLDGTLVLACRHGLVLLDFITDGVYHMYLEGSIRFSGGLALRNSPDFRSQVSSSSKLSTARLNGVSCRTVEPVRYGGGYGNHGYQPHVIVGHPHGCTVVRLRSGLNFAPHAYRIREPQLIDSKIYHPGTDFTAAVVRSLITESTSLDFDALGLRPGSYVTGPGGGSYAFLSTDLKVLTAGVADSGQIEFTVDADFLGGFRDGALVGNPLVGTSYDGVMVFAGTYDATFVSDPAWLDDHSEGDLQARAYPDLGVTEVRGIAMRSRTEAFVATDVGVLRVREDETAVIAYGTGAPASYTLLPGLDCRAIRFDDETRSLCVAVYLGDGVSEIVYIDIARQVAYKTVRVQGLVRSLSFSSRRD